MNDDRERPLSEPSNDAGCEEACMQVIAPDRHAYVTAASPRLTTMWTVQGVPQMCIHSLGLYRTDQDIICSSSAGGGQKTTRDAL